jgi:hypothetical protein
MVIKINKTEYNNLCTLIERALDSLEFKRLSGNLTLDDINALNFIPELNQSVSVID